MGRIHAEINRRGVLVFRLWSLTRPAPAPQRYFSNYGVDCGPSRSHGPYLSLVWCQKAEYDHNSRTDELPWREEDSSHAVHGSRFRVLSDFYLCVMNAGVRLFGGHSPGGSPQSSLSRPEREGGREGDESQLVLTCGRQPMCCPEKMLPFPQYRGKFFSSFLGQSFLVLVLDWQNLLFVIP